jgi:hypothetical protein
MILFRSATALVLGFAVTAASATAQQNTTVQLPTWNVSTVGTTVTVPDGGTGLLGGINRASEGSVSRGVPLLNKVPGLNRFFRNQAIGRDIGSSNMTIMPRIINLEEEELRQTGFSRETLAQLQSQQTLASRARGLDPSVADKAQFIAQNIARHDFEPVAPIGDPQQAIAELEQVRRQNQLAAAKRAEEAADLFAEGRRAESEGKANVAKIYYRMAARQARGELLDEIAARLAIVSGTVDGTPIAGR